MVRGAIAGKGFCSSSYDIVKSEVTNPAWYGGGGGGGYVPLHTVEGEVGPTQPGTRGEGGSW